MAMEVMTAITRCRRLAPEAIGLSPARITGRIPRIGHLQGQKKH